MQSETPIDKGQRPDYVIGDFPSRYEAVNGLPPHHCLDHVLIWRAER